GRDQGIYAVVGDRILHGGPPYLGTWAFKPPGIFFVYAASQLLFGRAPSAIRYLEAASFILVCVAFVVLSTRHIADERAGIFAGALALLVHTQLEFWNAAQPESFAAGVRAWALVCATYEPSANVASGTARRLLAWAASGALFSAAAV